MTPDAPHTFAYAPDFARALVRLGAEPSAWGRAWHVPSPSSLTLPQTLTRAASLAGVKTRTIHRIPKLVLRAVGFVVPIVGELPEVVYHFDTPFVMDGDDYRTSFEPEATDWDVALQTTLEWWQHELW